MTGGGRRKSSCAVANLVERQAEMMWPALTIIDAAKIRNNGLSSIKRELFIRRLSPVIVSRQDII